MERAFEEVRARLNPLLSDAAPPRKVLMLPRTPEQVGEMILRRERENRKKYRESNQGSILSQYLNLSASQRGH